MAQLSTVRRIVGARTRSAGSRLAFDHLAPERRFVIVTVGRTGSELLVSLLNSHPQIMCDGEILELRQPFPGQLVLRRALRARLRGQAYGFKLLGRHARQHYPYDPAPFLRRFYERGFRLIVLERRDRLAQAMSALRAEGRPAHHRGRDGAQFAPLRADPEALLAALVLLEQGVAFIRETLQSLPALQLVYEDDLQDPLQQQRTVNRVCDHLGLDAAPVDSELVRIAPTSVVDQVENFDEVAALLSHTRFAGLLPASARQAGAHRSG
jgi:LPS sulfotransferase NodH